MAVTTEGQAGTAIGESRLLIDGELTEAKSGARFDNVNPATEEVLGGTADASVDDMRPRDRRGAAGVRRDRLEHEPGAAPPVPRAAAGRARGRAGGAARGARGRGRVPGPHHLRTATRRAAGGRPGVAGRDDRRVRVGAGPARRARVREQQPAHGREGAGRRGRGDHSVELPVRGDDPEAGSGAGDGQHDDREACSRHALERHPHRSARRRAHRHPRRCVQRRRRHRITSSARSSCSTPASISSRSRARRRPAAASWRRAPRR